MKDADGKDVTANYTLGTQTKGKLTITDRKEKYEITVKANSSTGNVYDGTEKSATGFETLEFTVEGNKYTVSGLTTSDPSSVNVTTVANAISGTAVVKDANNNDVTAQFTVKTENGSLEITAREVTVKVEDKTVEYNGSEQYGNTETTFSNVVSGQTATIGYTASKGTLVNTYDNGVYAADFAVKDADGKDVTANYTLGTQTKGKLTITDENVPDDKVVTKTDGKVNDDRKYHIGDTVEWTVTVTNIYDEEKTLTVTEAAGMTIIGTVPKTLTAGQTIDIKVQHVVTAEDVIAGTITNNVSVKLGDLEKHGDDTVTTEPTEITITADSAKKVYDGTALTKNSAKVTKGTLASGDKIGSVTVTGSQTLVGESDNVPSNAKIVNAKNEDVTKAYIIKYANGKLKVTDGTNPDDPTPVPDDKVVTKTDANTGTRYYEGDTVTWNIWVKNIYDETKTLTVTENLKGVTLKPAPPATAIPATLGAGDEITLIATYTVTAADVEAGRVTNTVKVKLGDLEKNGNDTVITQTPVIVTISGFQTTVMYDGQVHSIEGFEAKSNNDEYNKGMNEDIGIDSNITFSGGDGILVSARDVVYNLSVDLSTIRFENINPNFPKVEFVFNPANHHNILTILPRNVVLTSGSSEKEYDGEPLTNDTVTVTGNGFAPGEGATYNVTGTQTDEGSSQNTFTYTLNGGTQAGNYNITTNFGTLTVLAAEIIEEDETPKAAPEEEIEDDETPLAAPTWALINLIASILTVVTSAGMIITYFKKKEDDEEANEDGTVRQLTDEEKQAEEEENERKKSKFLGLIPGIGSVITFLLTEDMRNQMVLTDKWTILMLAILVIGAAMAYLTRNQKDEEEEQPEET